MDIFRKFHHTSYNNNRGKIYRFIYNHFKFIWILFLLQDLNVASTTPPVLYRDNQSALHIAYNLVFHERTKHLEIDFHLVMQKLARNSHIITNFISRTVGRVSHWSLTNIKVQQSDIQAWLDRYLPSSNLWNAVKNWS
jgi:hypothetical protein